MFSKNIDSIIHDTSLVKASLVVYSLTDLITQLHVSSL